MSNVHYFESSGSAYNACQCDEKIKNGDVLVIESEKVVGLAWAWPLAISPEGGELHKVNPGRVEAVMEDAKIRIDQVKDALDAARAAGIPVDNEWALVGSGGGSANPYPMAEAYGGF